MMSVMEKETYAPKHDGIAITTMHQHYGLSTSLRSAGMVGSVLYCLSCVQPVQAAPVGGVVVGGEAQISRTGGDVTIHQGTDRAAIDWERFDIDTGETTRFIQPSASSAALNRVTGSTDASRIAGNLQSNGHVVLLNPNGVVFERGSRVDVGGLIASSADTDAARFMQGGTLKLDRPGNPNAVIINHGDITARDAGLVGMVAPNVENHGAIRAKLGKVALAAGDTAEIDLYGDGLISVQASDAVTKQLVRNTGSIDAAGGEILLTAAHGRQLIDNLVRVSGELRAPSVTQQGGRIIISGERATVDVSARMDASGEQVAGRVLIGGTYQGRDESIPNAAHTILHKPAIITANATNGKGGEVIVWADDTADVSGTIEAKGANTTQGGFVETSGKQTLLLREDINVNTNGGTWLIDPQDITIDSTGNPNTIPWWQISAALAGNHVVIHTSNGSTAGTGNITVNEPMQYTNVTNSLSLLAHDNIYINRNIQNFELGAINLIAGWDGTTGFSATPWNTATSSYGAVANNTDTGAPILDETNPNGILNPVNNAYGNRNGSLIINSETNGNWLYVGTRGLLNVAGYNVNVGSVNSSHPVTLGYQFQNQDDIVVNALNDVVIQAGNTDNAYARIGSGMKDAAASGYNGDITVNARNVILNASDHNIAAAKIGHGNINQNNSTVDYTGNITINASNDITLNASGTSGGNRFNYAHIGHGVPDGNDSGNRVGNVVVIAGRELSLIDADPDDNSFIGHYTASDGIDGNVKILANALDFTSATTGTFDLDNTLFANNMMANLAGGDVTIGSTGTAGMIINTDWFIADSDDYTGNLTFLSGRDINITNDVQYNETSLVATGSNTLTGLTAIAGWDGNTGFNDSADTSFDADAVLTDANSYGNNNGSLTLNNSGRFGSRNGRTVTAAYNTTLIGNDTSMIGSRFEAPVISLEALGSISVYNRNNLTLQGVSTRAYIGHGGFSDNNLTTSGSIDVRAKDINLIGGSTIFDNVQIGHGGHDVNGNHSGNITINAENITLQGGSGQYSIAQIGHGGYGTDGNMGQAGDLLTINANSLTLHSAQAGGLDSYALIGNGGEIITGTIQGDIDLNITNDVTLTASNQARSFAQIGNAQGTLDGTPEAAVILGNLNLDAANITLDSTAVTDNAFTQIGHGGFRTAGGDMTGDITINSTGDITLRGSNAGGSDEGYAMIGHAGAVLSNGNSTGNITINNTGDISLQGGSGNAEAIAMIGHGEYHTGAQSISSGNRTGNLLLNSGGEISVVNNTGAATIGHHTSAGTLSGNTRILAGALDFDAATTGTFNVNNADFIASINRNLAGGAVTIGSTGANGLAWNTALATASANTVSLLSARDLTLNTDITHNTAGATLNAVAGWDGTTGLNANGTINTSTIRSSGVTGAGSLLHTGGTLTAPTIYLDANNSLQGVVNTTALDIGVSSNNASLTGLVATGADQAAANMITGGPGNHVDYRFENFIIRFIPGSTPTGTPVVTPPPATSPSTPDIITPDEAVIAPVITPVAVVTPEPQPVPPSQPETEITTPPVSLPTRMANGNPIPNTVEIVTQTPVQTILRDGIGLNDSPTRTSISSVADGEQTQDKKINRNKDSAGTTPESEKKKTSLKKRSILQVHPTLKSLFNIEKDLL